MSKELDFAIATAKEAGDYLMSQYGKMHELEWKLKTNFKTEVDDYNDVLIRRRIQENFPHHNIYSEEQDALLNEGSSLSWVIDPLDGTIPYRYGITDHFSVCIALVSGKTPLLGVTYAPKRNELYFAERGKGAFCNGEKIQVLDEDNINKILIGLDGGKETETFKRAALAKYEERLYSSDGVTCTLSSGCASVPLALVASGKLHAYMALSLEPWDMAAGVIINREAGAKVTNIKNEEWTLDDPSIITANPSLHRNLYNFVRDIN